MRSKEPFHDTLDVLLKLEKISQRELSRRLASDGHKRHHSTLARIYTGEIPPTPHDVEVIAACLMVPPETFAEYRLWKAQRRFDPSAVGWNSAVEALAGLDEDERARDRQS